MPTNTDYTDNIKNIKTSSMETSKEKTNKGTLFFLSFDLVNSTKFKTLEPGNWIQKIKSFYELVEKHAHSISEEAYIWKKQGDEVLLYFTLKNIQELQNVFGKIHTLLNELIKIVADGEGKGTLSVKATFWTALVTTSDKGFAVSSTEDTVSDFNLAIEEPMGGYDFIGPDIDFGFRIAAKNAGGILCVDPKIIAMLKQRSPNISINYFAIVDFVQLKGIWKDRFVPIIWHHPNLDKPETIFPYDESKRNELVAILLNNKSAVIHEQNINSIIKVFEDINKKDVIERLIDCMPSFEISTGRMPNNRIAEVHIVAIVFNTEKDKVFCAKRATEKHTLANLWENGCCQLERSNDSLENIVKTHYKKEFNIEIAEFKMDTSMGYKALHIVGAYSFTNKFNKNIPGFIITAIAGIPSVDQFDKSKHSQVKWFSLDEIENLADGEIVQGFKKRIKCAHQLWQT